MSPSADNITSGICVAAVKGQAGGISNGSRLPPPPPLPVPPSHPPPPPPSPSQPILYYPHHPLLHFEPEPEPEPEPITFDDDEPLVHIKPVSKIDSHQLTIKAIPEQKAVASSQSAPDFAVLVSLKAPSLWDDDVGALPSQRAPADIVMVLDVSGSMSGRKLSLVNNAVHFVVDNLSASDRLSIVWFSDHARRILPLRRMTESGRAEAKRAADSLVADGCTNIVQGLKKGARVLEERKWKNPVHSIMFLSDGLDTYGLRRGSQYMQLLPRSIFSRNGAEAAAACIPVHSIFPKNGADAADTCIPVHSFGFGSDHDPVTMHAISDASAGTFSFIESHEMVQDAFAGCIGGLLSVVTQELRLKLRSASHGVEIKSIPSGRYRSEVTNQGTEGVINVGELYADEEKEFLINLSVPITASTTTTLLDITCTYKESISKRDVLIEADLVEILRPEVLSPQEVSINLDVDRQRNRLLAAESIRQAQEMAEAGNYEEAKKLLEEKRKEMMNTASGQAGDGLSRWLEGEMRETEVRMESASVYQKSGRAYALSGMSSHAWQRATTRGSLVVGAPPPPPPPPCGAAPPPGCCGPPPPPPAGVGCGGAFFRGYATPHMANMVGKSREQSKKTSN